MPGDDDVENHMAEMFPAMVADLQRSDVAAAEEKHKLERTQRKLLRESQPNQGMTAGELLKKLDGDPAEEQRKIQDELTKLNKEAADAAAAKQQNDPLPTGHFPPPPKSA